jgi:hypothetical protein
VNFFFNCAPNPLKGAKDKQLVFKSPLGDLGAVCFALFRGLGAQYLLILNQITSKNAKI